MGGSNLKDLNYNDDNSRKKCRFHLTCSESTRELIVEDCIKEYLSHHPEMEGAKISQNHILKQIAEHYLRSP